MAALPVIAVRLLDGRVGSTMLLQLLATSEEVAIERRYPEGEFRYFSYCLRVANWIATPWDSASDAGVTELFFGPKDRGGPLPFTPSLVNVSSLGPSVLTGMWEALSGELQRTSPAARYYAEKLAGDAHLLLESQVPFRLIDLVRDPRDIFCSIRAFTRGGPGFGRKVDQPEDEFLDQMVARHWERLHEMTNVPDSMADDVLLIRYEDLVTDLAQYAASLGAWLGVSLRAGEVLAQQGAYRHHRTTESVADSIGRWRRELRPEQAGKIWEALGAQLEPLGYTAQ